MPRAKKIALVTGGNKGIGLAVCRELARAGCRVLLGGRDADRVDAAVKKLRRSKLDVSGLVLDVADAASVLAALRAVQRDFGKLHILVNNAGILIDAPPQRKLQTVQLDTIRATFEINFYGVLRMVQAFLPMMKEQNYGRIVNVSSQMGQLTDSNGDFVAYRTSKTALNSLTRIIANDVEEYNIKCNAVCPGWVRTDMGGQDADRTPKKGAETIVWLALQGNNSPNGGFYQDKNLLAW